MPKFLDDIKFIDSQGDEHTVSEYNNQIRVQGGFYTGDSHLEEFDEVIPELTVPQGEISKQGKYYTGLNADESGNEQDGIITQQGDTQNTRIIDQGDTQDARIIEQGEHYTDTTLLSEGNTEDKYSTYKGVIPNQGAYYTGLNVDGTGNEQYGEIYKQGKKWSEAFDENNLVNRVIDLENFDDSHNNIENGEGPEVSLIMSDETNHTSYSGGAWIANSLGVVGRASTGLGRYIRISSGDTFISGYSNQDYSKIPSGANFASDNINSIPRGELTNDLAEDWNKGHSANFVAGRDNRIYAGTRANILGAYNVTVGGSNTLTVGYNNRTIYTADSAINLGYENKIIGTSSSNIIMPIVIGEGNTITHSGAIIIGQDLTSKSANEVQIGLGENAIRISDTGVLYGRGFKLSAGSEINEDSEIPVLYSDTIRASKEISSPAVDIYTKSNNGSYRSRYIMNNTMFKIDFDSSTYFYIARTNETNVDGEDQCFFEPKVYFNNGLSSSKAPINDNDVVRKVELTSAKSDIESQMDELSDVVRSIENNYVSGSYLDANYYNKSWINKNTAKQDVYTRLDQFESDQQVQDGRLSALKTDLQNNYYTSSYIDNNFASYGIVTTVQDLETNFGVISGYVNDMVGYVWDITYHNGDLFITKVGIV